MHWTVRTVIERRWDCKTAISSKSNVGCVSGLVVDYNYERLGWLVGSYFVGVKALKTIEIKLIIQALYSPIHYIIFLLLSR